MTQQTSSPSQSVIFFDGQLYRWVHQGKLMASDTWNADIWRKAWSRGYEPVWVEQGQAVIDSVADNHVEPRSQFDDMTIEERVEAYLYTKEMVIECNQMSPSCSYTFGQALPTMAEFGITKEDVDRIHKPTPYTPPEIIDWDDEIPF